MMAVRKLRFDIKVAGLVHIGNGQKYGKKDYFASGGKIAVLDVREFVRRLNPDQVSRYCEYLGDMNDKFGLQWFLGNKRNADLLRIAERSIAYRIDSPLATARRGSIQYHDVWQFVKDPYGNPYVPGSSVKGMLRSALLLSMVLGDAGLRDAVDVGALLSWEVSRDRNTSNKLNRKAFWKDCQDACDDSAVSDIMKYVSVSDSAPLSTDDLVFAKKYDRFSKDDPVDHKLDMGKLTILEGNELDVYRECLRPGTTVSVDVVVDDRVDGFLTPLRFDAQGISDMFQRAFDFYSERFLSHFDGEGGGTSDEAALDGRCRYVLASGPLAGSRCRNKAVDGTGYCNTHKDAAGQTETSEDVYCYLGGGVDFVSKTVTSALFDDEEEAIRAVSRVLYNQFPTRIDPEIYPGLFDAVRQEGFNPLRFEARRRNGRLDKGKDDHRHWRGTEIGISPHTMKWGIVGKERFPMGKCSISVREV